VGSQHNKALKPSSVDLDPSALAIELSCYAFRFCTPSAWRNLYDLLFVVLVYVIQKHENREGRICAVRTAPQTLSFLLQPFAVV